MTSSHKHTQNSTVKNRHTRECEDCRDQGGRGFSAIQSTNVWTSYLHARTLHHFQARETIFHEGLPVESVHILCDGEVKLSVKSGAWTNRAIRFLSSLHHPCEILDKACLSASTHTVTCETLTPCQVCCISREDFFQLMREEPELGDSLMKSLSHEVGFLVQHFHEEIALPARGRLAKVLLDLGERQKASMEKEMDVVLSLRRQELADIVGLSRETTARILNEFSHSHMLSLNGKRMTILDRERLAALTKFPS